MEDAIKQFGQAPLLTACCLVPVNLLLDWWTEKEVDLNMCDPNGWSLLSLALMYDNTTVWQHLLRHNVLVNNGSITSLRVAIARRNTEAVDMLLDAGADVNRIGLDDPRCCLSEASLIDDIGTMRKLVERGANLNPSRESARYSTQSPLILACKYAWKAQTVDFLVTNGANVNEVVSGGHHRVASPLETAARYRKPEIVEALLDHGAGLCLNPSAKNIIDGITKPSAYQTFQQFLDRGYKPVDLQRCLQNTTIDLCCGGFKACVHRSELFDKLLDLGADINAVGQGPTILQKAVTVRSVSLIRFVQERGANINLVLVGHYLETALSAAAYNGWVLGLRHLLGHGADVKQHSRFSSPLLATLKRRTIVKTRKTKAFRCAEVLLNAGANVNAVCPDAELETALMATCVCDTYSRDRFELFLEHGADVNLSTERQSPLSIAAGEGNYEALRALLERGADPNCLLRGCFGSALAAGAYHGRFEECKLLLRSGAHPGSRLYGLFRNALEAALCGSRDYAADLPLFYFGHPDVVRLLLISGSKPPMPVLKSPDLPQACLFDLQHRLWRVRSTASSHRWPLVASLVSLPSLWAAIFWRLSSVQPNDFRRTLKQWFSPRPLPSFYVIIMAVVPDEEVNFRRPCYAAVVLRNETAERFFWAGR
ncbi:hypothetical protein FSARC_10745, partial [Fusarium sarcochroum]